MSRTFEAFVAEVVPETDDTVTVLLATDGPVDYKAGQFVTIDPHQFEELTPWIDFLEDKMGRREPARAYSLASAPHERYLAITVKEERYVAGETEFPPLLSPLLVRQLRAGLKVEIGRSAGGYVLPEDVADRTQHVVHVCAGSGVVPNWSMIKHALAADVPVRHTLVYGNRRWRDVIYREELSRLCRKHPERLRVVHALSRDERPGAERGRVSAELLGRVIGDKPERVQVFACGPAITRHQRKKAKAAGEEPTPRFMETVKSALAEIGVPKQCLHTESYG